MHSIDNLFKLNELKINKKNINFETMSKDELKQNYETFKTLTNNKKLINSLPDKGQKIFQQFKHIEEVMQTRFVTKQEIENITDKLQNTNIELNKEEKQEALPAPPSIKNKKEDLKLKEKENMNYFAKKLATTSSNLNKQNLNLNEVKEKVKKKLEEQNKASRTAKSIPFEEAVKLLEQREKRVQEYQLEQTAKKLLEGQSVTYDYSFANKTEKYIKKNLDFL